MKISVKSIKDIHDLGDMPDYIDEVEYSYDFNGLAMRIIWYPKLDKLDLYAVKFLSKTVTIENSEEFIQHILKYNNIRRE